MDLREQCRLSYYEPITVLSEEHGVFLVRHQGSGRLFVKKELTVFHKEVYQGLMRQPVKGIPAIIDLFEDGDKLIIIEEYINGFTLEKLLEVNGRFSERDVVSFGLKLSSILTALHSRTPAIVHRDIKPSNIIATSDGTVYLLDLNAAKYADRNESRDTELIGTPGYAAPEQYGFGSSEARTDIFALGMLLNKLATGKFPSEAKVPGRLGKIIERCTRMDPEKRYSDADAVHEALRALSKYHGVSGQNTTSRKLPGFRSGKPLHKALGWCTYGLLAFCFYMMFAVDTEDPFPMTLFLTTFAVGGIFMEILLIFNYRGILNRLGPGRIPNKWLRLLTTLLTAVIAAFLWFGIFYLISKVFFISNGKGGRL